MSKSQTMRTAQLDGMRHASAIQVSNGTACDTPASSRSQTVPAAANSPTSSNPTTSYSRCASPPSSAGSSASSVSESAVPSETRITLTCPASFFAPGSAAKTSAISARKIACAAEPRACAWIPDSLVVPCMCHISHVIVDCSGPTPRQNWSTARHVSNVCGMERESGTSTSFQP